MLLCDLLSKEVRRCSLHELLVVSEKRWEGLCTVLRNGEPRPLVIALNDCEDKMLVVGALRDKVNNLFHERLGHLGLRLVVRREARQLYPCLVPPLCWDLRLPQKLEVELLNILVLIVTDPDGQKLVNRLKVLVPTFFSARLVTVFITFRRSQLGSSGIAL